MALLYKELGLRKEEYQRICELLGREPNYLELSMFSVMWSEHCAYKHSKEVLKMLPTEAPWVLQGPGENAGAVDIGDNLAVVFKIESHNHPSAIEPYQGAATGIGGIVRDIFAMGARPIALLDSLRFGSLKKPRVKYLFEGVVAGISSYGNCIGVPTVGGDLYFEEAYEGNPLVNVMCVGLVERENIIKGHAKGEGNLVLLIGSKTGRDGIHGCTFASEELGQELETKKPAVQVGDPFTEKLLIEACLELVSKNLLVALQDLGAAGLTSSSSEMASKGGVGIEIDVLKVPRRERGMQPFEVMISESQERMLAIVEPEKISQALEVCQKWGLDATVIGKVINSRKIKVYEGENLVGEIPTYALTKEAPVYNPKAEKPQYLAQTESFNLKNLTHPKDLNEVLVKLLCSPNLSFREWVYSQYDYMVQTNTIGLPGSDAAILRIKGTKKAIALSVDGNGRYSYLDPLMGGQIAVAEAARNVVVSGAKPLALTNCLNFGTPEDPQIFWQFKEAVKGIARACQALGIPVVSGNVSFYNESFQKAIYPTPIIGMVGLLEDVIYHTPMGFVEEGNLILLLGETRSELGGSEYLKEIFGIVKGKPPLINLEEEKRIQALTLAGIKEGIILSAHDVSEGGLAVALAECALTSGMGARIDEINIPLKPEFLFSESQSRVIITLRGEDLPRLKILTAQYDTSFEVLGHVSGEKLVIGNKIDLEVKEVAKIWREALPKLVKG